MKKNLLTLLLIAVGYSMYSQITFDGNINETQWGTPLSTSSGGPAPGFGAGHEINAIYVFGKDNDLFFAIAGNVQNNNRILLFIDSKSGGYTNGNFGRSAAPQGIDDFNSGTTFDTSFEPDYVLVIGTNMATDNYFFDLYTLSGTAVPASGGGPNNYLGDINTSNIGASPMNASNTKGFEISIPKSTLGYNDGNDIKVFAAYISDGGFLSNQFLTPAGSMDGNYGSGPVTFGSASPNPITVPFSVLPVELQSFQAINNGKVNELLWITASETNNSHFEVMRSYDAKTWQTIGKVLGKGTTLEQQKYHFTDMSPLKGTSYYKLKQIDIDGTFAYSEIAVVNKANESNSNFSIFPNPTSGLLQYNLNEEHEIKQIELYSTSGKLLKTITNINGFISLEDQQKGIYFLSITTKSNRFQEIIVKQ